MVNQESRVYNGNSLKGYNKPLEYVTDKARVAVDYKPINKTSGKVKVQAAEAKGGRLLIDEEFLLNGGSTTQFQ